MNTTQMEFLQLYESWLITFMSQVLLKCAASQATAGQIVRQWDPPIKVACNARLLDIYRGHFMPALEGYPAHQAAMRHVIAILEDSRVVFKELGLVKGRPKVSVTIKPKAMDDLNFVMQMDQVIRNAQTVPR